MHPALRKGPLFTKKHSRFSTFFYKTPPISHFFYKKKHSPISFRAYGPARRVLRSQVLSMHLALLSILSFARRDLYGQFRLLSRQLLLVLGQSQDGVAVLVQVLAGARQLVGERVLLPTDDRQLIG